MAEKRVIDWESIWLEYRAGVKTLREIASSHGITHAAIHKRALRDGWDRDLAIRIKQKSEGFKLPEKDDMDSSGFIYVIYVDTGLERIYKIGLAKHFGSRFSHHQCTSPFDILVSIVYFTENMRLEEKTLHTMFYDKRVRGEWFKLNGDDLMEIAKRSYIGG